MARTIAALSAGARLSDYISLGVLSKTISPRKVREVAVRVIRRKLPQLAASPPSAVEGAS